LDCFDPSSVVEIACKGEPVRKCTVSAALSDDRYPAIDYAVLPGSVTIKDDIVHIPVAWNLTWGTFKKSIDEYFANKKACG
jgi:hypothetical protein